MITLDAVKGFCETVHSAHCGEKGLGRQPQISLTFQKGGWIRDTRSLLKVHVV